MKLTKAQEKSVRAITDVLGEHNYLTIRLWEGDVTVLDEDSVVITRVHGSANSEFVKAFSAKPDRTLDEVVVAFDGPSNLVHMTATWTVTEHHQMRYW